VIGTLKYKPQNVNAGARVAGPNSISLHAVKSIPEKAAGIGFYLTLDAPGRRLTRYDVAVFKKRP
jgi:hypothetical protein